jgi:hypothetical protein
MLFFYALWFAPFFGLGFTVVPVSVYFAAEHAPPLGVENNQNFNRHKILAFSRQGKTALTK